MDTQTALYAGATAIALLGASFYTALRLLTPPPIRTHSSERTYLSAAHPSKPAPLPSLADPPSCALSVIVPAYNETARLPSMLASTLEHLRTIPSRTYEIVIVDDGSKDGTPALALRLAKENKDAEIRVAKLEKNLGKGGAVRHGMLYARGERLLFVDADGASRFADLELLWSAMDKLEDPEGRAVAIGSRAHLVKTDAVVKRSLLRNILMYGLHTLLLLTGTGHIRDTQCGFKLFSRPAARALFPAQHLCTWIFDVELLLLAKMQGIPVAEVPVQWEEVAGSKLNVVRDSLQMLRDLVVLRANLLLGRWRIEGMKANSKTKPSSTKAKAKSKRGQNGVAK